MTRKISGQRMKQLRVAALLDKLLRTIDNHPDLCVPLVPSFVTQYTFLSQ